jgi:hypothetical protein
MPLMDIFWTTLLIFAWITFFMLLFRVYGDLFSRRDIGGWAKAGWVLVTFVLPFIGILVYLISQGRGMADRAVEGMQRQRDALDDHIRAVAAEGRAEQMTVKPDALVPGGVGSRDQHDRVVASGS